VGKNPYGSRKIPFLLAREGISSMSVPHVWILEFQIVRKKYCIVDYNTLITFVGCTVHLWKVLVEIVTSVLVVRKNTNPSLLWFRNLSPKIIILWVHPFCENNKWI